MHIFLHINGTLLSVRWYSAEVPRIAANGIGDLRVMMRIYTFWGSDCNHCEMVSTMHTSVIISHKVSAMWYQKVYQIWVSQCNLKFLCPGKRVQFVVAVVLILQGFKTLVAFLQAFKIP